MKNQRPFGKIVEQLRSVGLRPTRQRMALAKLLFDGPDRHVTAEILHSEAFDERVRVSLATVYNTLHQFTTAGMLKEIVIDSGRSYFDTNVSDHHHFYNEDSRELFDIAGSEISFDQLPTPPDGNQVSGVDVVVRVRST